MWLVAVLVGTATVAPVFRPPANLPDAPFSVTADRLSAEGGLYVAEGNVVLRRQGAVVRADRIELDEKRGVAIAEGNVTAAEGTSVMTCRRVETKIPELTGGLEQGRIRVKSELPKELLDRLTAKELETYGEDEMILEAEKLDRTGEKTFEVDGGSFTVCDCGEDSTPSWRIEASSAELDLDEGALLWWPVFYAKQVPVFALPAFYFPLGERRTGLLTPRPSYSQIAGPSVTQPLYVTLGRSADLTFEASYLSERGPGAGSRSGGHPPRLRAGSSTET